MTKTEEVEKTIIKKLPRLKELKKGCLIKRIKHNNLFDTLEVLKITNTELITTNLDSTGSFNTQVHRLDDFYKLDYYEIIGKEPTVLDALLCLDETEGNFGMYSLTADGEWYYRGQDLLENPIDLSKPSIKDLEEETINFLHSVLCKNI